MTVAIMIDGSVKHNHKFYFNIQSLHVTENRCKVKVLHVTATLKIDCKTSPYFRLIFAKVLGMRVVKGLERVQNMGMLCMQEFFFGGGGGT